MTGPLPSRAVVRLALVAFVAPIASGSQGSGDEPSGPEPAAQAATFGLAERAEIAVRVVDSAGEPAPGVRVVVHEGLFADEALATAVTDAAGVARLLVAESRWLQVDTLPEGGRAPGAGVVRARPGERAELEIVLPRGGSIGGRVVDDLGRPVAGLAIDRAPTPAEVLAGVAEPLLGIAVAVTDEEGRFRVPSVASLPRWHLPGDRVISMAPERVGLAPGPCVFGGSWRDRGYVVLAGEEIDTGDLVVPRPSTYRGRVVDARGRAVPGALVSVNPKRLRATDGRSSRSTGRGLRTSPGRGGFALLVGETLTDGDGRFSVEGRDAPLALVRTPVGTSRLVELAPLDPGERSDELLLDVGCDEVLELVLVEADGARAVEGRDLFAWAATRPTGRRYTQASGARAELLGPGDRPWTTWVAADADGVFRVPLPFAREELRRLSVFLTGWLPIQVGPDDLARDATPLDVRVEPFPTIRLSVRVPAQDIDRLEAPAERTTSIVRVDVCRLDAETRWAHRSWVSNGCCGAGSDFASWAHLARGATFELDMPVQEPDAYRVHVYDLPGRPAEVLAFGPFEPSDERHVIEVAPLPERDPDAGEVGRLGVVEEPPDGEPPGSPDPVLVRGRVVDGETGAPLAGAAFERGWARRDAGAQSDSAGRIHLPLAREYVERTLHLEGYVDHPVRLPESLHDVDLGVIRLEREPRTAGRVLEADGTPFQHRASLEVPVSSTYGTSASWESVDRRGRFETVEEIEPDSVAWVHSTRVAPGGGSIPMLQRARVRASDDGGWNVRVSPSREVEIHLLGWPPELVQSSASVDVAPMRAMRTDHAELREVVRGVSTGGVEVALADPTAARVFRVELSAGPYRVLVQSELVGYAETEVVVRDTDGVQVLELRPE